MVIDKYAYSQIKDCRICLRQLINTTSYSCFFSVPQDLLPEAKATLLYQSTALNKYGNLLFGYKHICQQVLLPYVICL
jgi:hypothetical protein